MLRHQRSLLQPRRSRVRHGRKRCDSPDNWREHENTLVVNHTELLCPGKPNRILRRAFFCQCTMYGLGLHNDYSFFGSVCYHCFAWAHVVLLFFPRACPCFKGSRPALKCDGSMVKIHRNLIAFVSRGPGPTFTFHLLFNIQPLPFHALPHAPRASRQSRFGDGAFHATPNQEPQTLWASCLLMSNLSTPLSTLQPSILRGLSFLISPHNQFPYHQAHS